jgi:hypothetical protein
MYLSATFDLPNGATAYVGRVAAIETSIDASTTTITINYFIDLTTAAVLWQAGYDVPSAVTTSGTYPDNIYTWLVSGSGPLNGATMLNDSSADIEDARSAKWVEVKALRDEVEFGGCSTALGLIDSDEVSQQRVTSTLAFADLIGATSFGVGWTMADNSVVWHNYSAFHEPCPRSWASTSPMRTRKHKHCARSSICLTDVSRCRSVRRSLRVEPLALDTGVAFSLLKRASNWSPNRV